ncbi:MAG: hypothetical protein HGA76_10855, partial [Candidatus Firestonebacteria bacterium]|nr:hypothetical protein [Candidatus Firestonebacteria bacterium]
GHWSWGLGLWLGAALGAGALFWMRWSVRAALGPSGAAGNPLGLLGHTLARILLIGLVFYWVLKKSALSVWAVLLGYTLFQLAAMLWQRWVLQGRKRGLNS